jgi:hypothetical protein
MDRIVRNLSELAHSPRYRSLQDELADSVYATLSEGYASGEYELPLVERFCEALDGEELDGCRLHATFIHGNKSLVSFNMQGHEQHREMGDMAFVSLMTRGSDVMYARVAIVQNKKESGALRWTLDLGQLYLLEHFPTFTFFRGTWTEVSPEQVTLLNSSRLLGCYGLFSHPGEMYFTDAGTVSRAKLNKTVALNLLHQSAAQNVRGAFMDGFLDPFMLEEMMYEMRNRFLLPTLSRNTLSGVHNRVLNLLDFIRALTLMQIGETVEANGRVYDAHLQCLVEALLRRVGAHEGLVFARTDSPEYLEVDPSVFDGLAVFVIRHSLPE